MLEYYEGLLDTKYIGLCRAKKIHVSGWPTKHGLFGHLYS
jgi:hypothetical protein